MLWVYDMCVGIPVQKLRALDDIPGLLKTHYNDTITQVLPFLSDYLLDDIEVSSHTSSHLSLYLSIYLRSYVRCVSHSSFL